jgi:hypothetical protein
VRRLCRRRRVSYIVSSAVKRSPWSRDGVCLGTCLAGASLLRPGRAAGAAFLSRHTTHHLVWV